MIFFLFFLYTYLIVFGAFSINTKTADSKHSLQGLGARQEKILRPRVFFIKQQKGKLEQTAAFVEYISYIIIPSVLENKILG